MNKALSSLLLPVIIILFFSCQKDEENETLRLPGQREYPLVDKKLWPFFQAFEEEAAERGLVIDLARAGIIGEIEEIPTEHVAGKCTYGTVANNEVVIDKTFWKTTPSIYYKEMVVFHELGHCYLGRGHTEDAMPNGACKSIMRSGDGACFDNYTQTTRESYLDELFAN